MVKTVTGFITGMRDAIGKIIWLVGEKTIRPIMNKLDDFGKWVGETFSKGVSGAKISADDIKFTDKFSKPGYQNQVIERGWSNQKIADAINKPYKVVDSVNKFTGNPAKAYFINDTHYVVIDTVTSKVVQVSKLSDSSWKFTPGDFSK